MAKRIIKSFLVIFASALIASPTFAAKPQNVISMSNGYPSGAHFNLIIHGKKTGNSDVATEDITTFNCPSGEGGNSVFVADYGNSTIQYISNKKASLAGLTVLDACAEVFDDNPAQVQLPYDEYYVFARLHGTPKNKHGEPSSVILTPNPVLQVCNYDETNPDANPDDFATYTECNESSLWVLGMVTTSGVYYATDHTAERYDTSKKGKGPKNAQEITGLFTWSGWVCDASLDFNQDGVIDENDVTGDLDGSGVIDSDDDYGALLDLCDQYINEWVFNLADLVVEHKILSKVNYHIRFKRSTPNNPNSIRLTSKEERLPFIDL
jgi:hypothetical protein